MALDINPELYIGSHELRRAFQGIQEAGYKKLFSAFVQTYGVAYVLPTSLQAVAGTTGPRWITVKAGLAVDKNLNLIYSDNDIVNAIEFPNTIGTQYLCIRWKERKTEKGTITVAVDGSVTGVGTEFTKVLRGAPLNQVKIRLPNSSNNLNDYPILEVIDDTHATLNSVTTLTAESGQKYAVVGCFTPSLSIPEAHKLIYSYDDYELFFSSQLNTDGISFRLAQVNWNGSNLTITDARLNNKLTLFDTTAQLVQDITASVINQYNLVITQQFASQISALNSAVAALQQADVNFTSQIAGINALLAQKANSAQESWRYVGEGGQPTMGIKWLNSLGGSGRTKFMKTTVGTVHVHVYVTAQSDAPFGDQITQLPEGYRPTTNVMVLAARWTGTGFPSQVWFQIDTFGHIKYMEQTDFNEDHRVQFECSFQTTS